MKDGKKMKDERRKKVSSYNKAEKVMSCVRDGGGRGGARLEYEEGGEE